MTGPADGSAAGLPGSPSHQAGPPTTTTGATMQIGCTLLCEQSAPQDLVRVP